MSTPAEPSSAPRRVSSRVKRPSLVKEEAEAEDAVEIPVEKPAPAAPEPPPPAAAAAAAAEPPRVKRKYTKRAKPNPPETPIDKASRNPRAPEEPVLPPLGLSDTLQEYLASSRLRWLNGAVFPLYWTRPPPSARKKDGTVPLPKDLNMTSHPVGSCTMVVEPHVFEVRFYGVKLPLPQVVKPKVKTLPVTTLGPTAPANAVQMQTQTQTQMAAPAPPMIQFRPPYMGPPGVSSPSQNLTQKPAMAATGQSTQPNLIDSLGTAAPGATQPPMNPSNPPQLTKNTNAPEAPLIKTEPSSKPPVSTPATTSTPIPGPEVQTTPKPLPASSSQPPKDNQSQPLVKAADAKALTVQALAERARTDKKFQSLMELVAKNTATQEERAKFQKQMHEIVAAAEKMAREAPVYIPQHVPPSQIQSQPITATPVPAVGQTQQAQPLQIVEHVAPPQAVPSQPQPLQIVEHVAPSQTVQPQPVQFIQQAPPPTTLPPQATRPLDPNAMDLDPPAAPTPPQPPARKKPGPKPKPKVKIDIDSPVQQQQSTPQPRTYTPKFKPPVPDPPIPRNATAAYQDLLLEFVPQGARWLFPRMALLDPVGALTYKLTFYHIYTVKGRKKFQPIVVYLTSTSMKIFDVMRSIVGNRDAVLKYMAETRSEVERAEETIPSVRRALEKVIEQAKEEDKEEEGSLTAFPAPMSLCV